MTDKMMPFDFDGNQVRVQLDEHGEPWFVATDIASILGYRDADKACRLLMDDEKGTQIVGTLGGPQNLRVISESGLYRLVTACRKPEAETFRRWVFHEVLPSIRKTGGYSIAQSGGLVLDINNPESVARVIKAMGEKILEQDRQLREAAPKVEGYDELINTDGLRGLQEAGKALGLKPRSFTKLLEKEGYIFRTSNDNLMPNQRYKDLGYFEVRSFVKNGESRSQAFVTKTGLDYFWRKFCSQSQQLSLTLPQ